MTGVHEECLLPHRVHRHMLTACEAHSPCTAVFIVLQNTGLVLFNMAGLSSQAQSMLPALHALRIEEGLSACCCYLFGEPASLTAGECAMVL